MKRLFCNNKPSATSNQQQEQECSSAISLQVNSSISSVSLFDQSQSTLQVEPTTGNKHKNTGARNNLKILTGNTSTDLGLYWPWPPLAAEPPAEPASPPTTLRQSELLAETGLPSVGLPPLPVL
jgi:hypothetical protein